MTAVAMFAIDLAAVHSLTPGPSGDSVALWRQLVAFILLFFVMPFHVMVASAWLTAGRE
jgi:hypothetical protein